MCAALGPYRTLVLDDLEIVVVGNLVVQVLVVAACLVVL